MANGIEQIPYWTADHVKATLPVRQETGHKGTFGTGLLIAGSPDMPGAAFLASLAAMRSGIGKLEVGTAPAVISSIVPSLPEATFLLDGLEKAANGEIELNHFKAIAAGPGLRPNAVTEKAIENLLASSRPLILDAGALSRRQYPRRNTPTVLTPHPLEFARMLGISKQELSENPVSHLVESANEWETILVLKSHETLIAFPDGHVWRNPTGNSALAKGGTGDTLTGMLLGMLCCHDQLHHAVLNAVFLHGACADEWTLNRSAHTLLAHELMDLLPEVWKQYEPVGPR